MSYQPPVWPRRLGRLLMGAVLGALALTVLGPSVRNIHIEGMISRCAHGARYAAAPWEDTSPDGFFSFDGTTRWIIANTTPKRDLFACTRRWAGFFIQPTSDPLPVLELGTAPYLDEWTNFGQRGFRFHPGAD